MRHHHHHHHHHHHQLIAGLRGLRASCTLWLAETVALLDGDDSHFFCNFTKDRTRPSSKVVIKLLPQRELQTVNAFFANTNHSI
uniref:Secreted protein n=1 Tax=Glossina pallidipes TaxID=7398 RepID=A0A1A9ZBT2_GLOPL